MNTLVKCFIVINLLLSVVFCAFSMVLFTNRQDWKQKYIESQTLLKDVEGQRDQIKTELNKKLDEQLVTINNLNTQRETLETERDRNADELKKTNSELTQLKQEFEMVKEKKYTVEDQLGKRTEELGKSLNELEKTRESAQGARDDLVDLRGQLVAFEKDISQLKTDLEVSKDRQKTVEDKLKEKEWSLTKLERNGIDVAAIVAREGEPETPIHAKVLAVRPDVNVVLLSVGKKDNAKEGYQLTIYKGGTYKGKVQIESVYPTMCSARILPELLAKNQTIEEGDSASTRIY